MLFELVFGPQRRFIDDLILPSETHHQKQPYKSFGKIKMKY